MNKPLRAKAYGSIPHLSGSRLGEKDYMANPGHEQILTVKARKGDTIVVEEKLDGSCCAVANVNGQIMPLTRAGWPAETSPYRQHHVFAAWVYARQHLFAAALLQPGDRLVGEWVLQAHGTRYEIEHDGLLFRPFDLMNGKERLGRDLVEEAADRCNLFPVPLLHRGPPIGAIEIMSRLTSDREGAVWRCENDRFGVELLAKFVRQDKVDGALLPEITGGVEVWNYDPCTAAEAA